MRTLNINSPYIQLGTPINRAKYSDKDTVNKAARNLAITPNISNYLSTGLIKNGALP
jgi:hypothetical protein